MKAKEYFEKYGEAVWEEFAKPAGERVDALVKLITDMNDELHDLLEKRKVKLMGGLHAVIREQNQKGNAIYEMFVKKYGQSPVKRNWFGLWAFPHYGFKLPFKTEVQDGNQEVG